MQTELTGFEKILKGYMGFLEGTGKSRLTISSYRGDLEVFRKFIQEAGIKFHDLTHEDFDRYHFYLIKKGLKTNTRRRKLITARSLCYYALTRKKIDLSPAQFVRPPDRVEKLPWVPKPEEYREFLKIVPHQTSIGNRNRLLVEMTAETALSISELCSLKWEDLQGTQLKVPGKRSRSLELSQELVNRLLEWKGMNLGKFLFPGYNRHGMATARMSPRGVEMMFRSVQARSNLPEMMPKTLRHYCILEWLKTGVPDKEIQRRLGVSSTYSLHAYKQYIAKSNLSN